NSVPGDPFFGSPSWWMNAWAWGVWWSGYGICPNTIPGGPGQNCINPRTGANGMSVFSAGGMHTGGLCNVALGDGSVRGINASGIDSLSLVYMAGARDGEIQPFDF